LRPAAHGGGGARPWHTALNYQGKEVRAVDLMLQARFEIAQIEHEERLREAERFRRASMARQDAGRSAAARKERRFSFFPFAFNRPTEA
jgi:hypothetical protein